MKSVKKEEDGTIVYSYEYDEPAGKYIVVPTIAEGNTVEYRPNGSQEVVDLAQVYSKIGPERFSQLFLAELERKNDLKYIEFWEFVVQKDPEMLADMEAMRTDLTKRFIEKWGPKLDFKTYLHVLDYSHAVDHPLDIIKNIIKTVNDDCCLLHTCKCDDKDNCCLKCKCKCYPSVGDLPDNVQALFDKCNADCDQAIAELEGRVESLHDPDGVEATLKQLHELRSNE